MEGLLYHVIVIISLVPHLSFCQDETVFHCSSKPGCQISQCDPIAPAWNQPGFSLSQKVDRNEFPITCKSTNTPNINNGLLFNFMQGIQGNTQDIRSIRSEMKELEKQVELNTRQSKGAKGDKGDPCQCDIADEEPMRKMRRKMEELTTQNEEMNKRILNLETENVKINQAISQLGDPDFKYPLTCKNNQSTEKIFPWRDEGIIKPVVVNCALYSVDEDGWITIQKRQNGSIDFYRNWESYATGFGDKDGEFWLGLRTIHQLTSTKNYKLRIDLRFKSGEVKYAEYSTLKVASDGSKFQLTISGYSGNADDRMEYHNDQYFSTYDVDNDNGSRNCAQTYQGAWWYKNCYYSNLNGKYDAQFKWGSGILTSTEMKIRLV